MKLLLALTSLIVSMLVVGHSTKPIGFASLENAVFFDSSAISKASLLSRAAILREIVLTNRDLFIENVPVATKFDALGKQVKMLMSVIVSLDEHSLQLGAYSKALDGIEVEKSTLTAQNKGAISYVSEPKHPIDKLLIKAVELHQLVEKNVAKFSNEQNLPVAQLFNGFGKQLEQLMKTIVALSETDVINIGATMGALKSVEDEVQLNVKTYQGIATLALKAEVLRQANTLLQAAKDLAAKFTADPNKASLANVLVQDIEAFIKGVNAVPDTPENMTVVRQQLSYVQQSFNVLKARLSA